MNHIYTIDIYIIGNKDFGLKLYKYILMNNARNNAHKNKT